MARLRLDPAGPPEALLARYGSYPWPGNVRELHNTVARRIALGDLATVGALREVPPDQASPTDRIDDVLALDLPLAHARSRIVEELESRYVERVLAHHGGNVARAAAASGIKRRYFQVLKARYAK